MINYVDVFRYLDRLEKVTTGKLVEVLAGVQTWVHQVDKNVPGPLAGSVLTNKCTDGVITVGLAGGITGELAGGITRVTGKLVIVHCHVNLVKKAGTVGLCVWLKQCLTLLLMKTYEAG